MAMSGVEVDPECKVAYDETLMGHMYRYVTFKIDGGKICIDKVRLAAFSCLFVDSYFWLIEWIRHLDLTLLKDDTIVLNC